MVEGDVPQRLLMFIREICTFINLGLNHSLPETRNANPTHNTMTQSGFLTGGIIPMTMQHPSAPPPR